MALRSVVLLGFLLAACGAKSELDLPVDAASGGRVAADGGPVVVTDGGQDAGPSVGFTTACSTLPDDWVLFDLGGEHGGLFAVRANGTDARRVHLPHGAIYPNVSPDGSQLLYASYPDQPELPDGGSLAYLYDYDLTTHVDTRLVTTSDLTYSALSPDKQRVAYVTGFSLHSILANGTNDVALLVGPDGNGFGYGHPTFAGDSFSILYGGGGTLGVIHADGTDDYALFSEGDVINYPNGAFSSDYRQVVAGTLCGSEAPFALLVYDYASLPAACSSGTLLVDTSPASSPNGANDPSWNPNGLIAYASAQDIYVIAAAGGTPRNLTAAYTTPEAGASDPVWLPACAKLP